MDKFCEDCIHNLVCQYGAIPPHINRCNDKDTYESIDEFLNGKKEGEWIDHSEEGYVECPFCEHLTTCEDNIDELHYCWNCGAKMKGGAENG